MNRIENIELGLPDINTHNWAGNYQHAVTEWIREKLVGNGVNTAKLTNMILPLVLLQDAQYDDSIGTFRNKFGTMKIHMPPKFTLENAGKDIEAIITPLLTENPSLKPGIAYGILDTLFKNCIDKHTMEYIDSDIGWRVGHHINVFSQNNQLKIGIPERVTLSFIERGKTVSRAVHTDKLKQACDIITQNLPLHKVTEINELLFTDEKNLKAKLGDEKNTYNNCVILKKIYTYYEKRNLHADVSLPIIKLLDEHIKKHEPMMILGLNRIKIDDAIMKETENRGRGTASTVDVYNEVLKKLLPDLYYFRKQKEGQGDDDFVAYGTQTTKTSETRYTPIENIINDKTAQPVRTRNLITENQAGDLVETMLNIKINKNHLVGAIQQKTTDRITGLDKNAHPVLDLIASIGENKDSIDVEFCSNQEGSKWLVGVLYDIRQYRYSDNPGVTQENFYMRGIAADIKRDYFKIMERAEKDICRAYIVNEKHLREGYLVKTPNSQDSLFFDREEDCVKKGYTVYEHVYISHPPKTETDIFTELKGEGISIPLNNVKTYTTKDIDIAVESFITDQRYKNPERSVSTIPPSDRTPKQFDDFDRT